MTPSPSALGTSARHLAHLELVRPTLGLMGVRGAREGVGVGLAGPEFLAGVWFGFVLHGDHHNAGGAIGKWNGGI